MKFDNDNFERDYLKEKRSQQPGFIDANREWQDGDIDWSFYEQWRNSIIDNLGKCSPKHRKELTAALEKLTRVASELLGLDPRYAIRGK
jgi:hypothetical protein